ncbi:MAG: hypothetical protein R3Y56_06830 [Akkermansia sp.]
MKTSPISTLLIFAASATLLSAAPAVSVKDISPATLKTIATPTQAASLKIHEEAKSQAETDRNKAIEEAKKLTTENDKGMKQTIQKRTLNNMLPACEREPETPRNPDLYIVR